MKFAAYICGLVGLTLLIALVVHQGYAPLLQALGQAGWPLLWLVPLRVVPICLDAQGWRTLLKPGDPMCRAPLPFLLWVASVREAVNRLLPVLSIGDNIVGIRLVMLRGLSGTTVTASVLVELLLTLFNQYLFVALGVVLLISRLHATPVTDSLLLGLLLTMPLPILFWITLRNGSAFTRIERLVEKLLGDRSRLADLLGESANLDKAVRAIFQKRGRMVRAALWQFAGMVAGASEVWLVLQLFGHAVSPWVAITLESATLGIRSFAFMVPGALGVQEAGLILVGPMVGLGADLALSLSLAKRVRELLFGLPALLSWQWFEASRFRRSLNERKADSFAPQ